MKSLNHWIVVALGSALATVAIAKLPTPVLTDEQKAKAEETKAKAAETAKKAAEAEQRAQDRVAERWFKEAKAAGKNPVASQWVAPQPPPSATQAAPAKPAVLPAKKG